MPDWIEVCGINDIDEEDVMGFQYADENYCIYNIDAGFFATAAACTHEGVSLADGFVIDCVIECPRHQGRFDIRTGKALSAPVCVDLRTFPVEVRDSVVFILV